VLSSHAEAAWHNQGLKPSISLLSAGQESRSVESLLLRVTELMSWYRSLLPKRASYFESLLLRNGKVHGKGTSGTVPVCRKGRRFAAPGAISPPAILGSGPKSFDWEMNTSCVR